MEKSLVNKIRALRNRSKESLGKPNKMELDRVIRQGEVAFEYQMNGVLGLGHYSSDKYPSPK